MPLKGAAVLTAAFAAASSGAIATTVTSENGIAASASGDVVWTYAQAGPGASGPPDAGQSSCETYYGIDNAAPVVITGKKTKSDSDSDSDENGNGNGNGNGAAATSGGTTTVFFTSQHSGWKLFALDAESGVEKWNVTASKSKEGGATAPAVDPENPDVVYFAAATGFKL